MISNSSIQTKKRMDFSVFTIIALTILLGAGLALTSPTFLSEVNIFSILYGVSLNFFSAIGFTYLMIMGEIDLSIGSVCAFSGMLVGMLMKQGLPLVPSLAISLVICALFGILNGFLVVRFKVSSMMITLGSMTAVRGLANLLCSNLYGFPYPDAYQILAKFRLGSVFLTIYIMVIVVIVLEIMLLRSAAFRKMYFVGENIETARIYGINSSRLKISVFMVSALLSAVSGILIGARLSFADTTIGNGLEFTVLTAAVLGGASLKGGKGSILRTCIALIFLATITNGMIIHNIDPLIQQLIVGIILILAVFIDTRMGLAGIRQPHIKAKEG